VCSVFGQAVQEAAGLQGRGLRRADQGDPADQVDRDRWHARFRDRREPPEAGPAPADLGHPITDPEAIAWEKPDVIVCFAWNFAEDVLAKLPAMIDKP
jgi:hypothetical protein